MSKAYLIACIKFVSKHLNAIGLPLVAEPRLVPYKQIFNFAISQKIFRDYSLYIYAGKHNLTLT